MYQQGAVFIFFYNPRYKGHFIDVVFFSPLNMDVLEILYIYIYIFFINLKCLEMSCFYIHMNMQQLFQFIACFTVHHQVKHFKRGTLWP